MKTTLLKTRIKNLSRYSIDIVWENAKDLEHIAYLHGKTNKFFQLMYVGSDPIGPQEYDVLIYRSVRKLFFLRINTFGFRRIISEYNIHQVEYIPLLGVTSALNSLLFRGGDSEFPTVMVDEVVMEMPTWMGFLKPYFKRAVKRHAAIQCQEDETFRERRQVLKKRGINLPFSLFNKSQSDKITKNFTDQLSQSSGNLFSAIEDLL